MRFSVTFPSDAAQKNFVNLVASNSHGAYGLGLGLEFEGLEYGSHNGRLTRIQPGKRATGDRWEASGADVLLTFDHIAHQDPDFPRLRAKLSETADNFKGDYRWSDM